MSSPASRRFALLCLTAVSALAACNEESSVPCTRDEDCRDGYRCDLTLYAGQCVQNVYVFRCGPNLCRYGVEQCVEEQCVRLVDGGMDGRDQGGGGAGGFGGQGGQGGQGGDPIDFGGAGGFDLGGGAGGGEPDAGEPLEAPRIVITAPFDGSTLLTEEPELVGQVFRLGGGTLRLVIDGEEPGQMLAPDADGRFRRTVRLNPGNHRLMVIAERGEDRVEEAVQIRIDAFVTTDGGGLRWGQRPFRFVGLSMPGLLDLAVANPEALDAVLAQAADLGATVIRTRAYDDRPMAASAIQTEPGAYAEPGLAALDLIVERAGFHGLKLILSLGDGGETYGGPTQYLRWAGYLVPVRTDQHLFFDAGPIREQFKNNARVMLTRVNGLTDVAYRSDPTILGWLVLDGVDPTGVYNDGTGNALADFFAELTQVVKVNAPDQLVGTGEVGFDVNPDPYGVAGQTLGQGGVGALLDGTHQVAWHRNLRLGTVDFGTIELDPTRLGLGADPNVAANLGAAWIRGHAVLAAVEVQPLMVFMRVPDGPYDLAGRRQLARAWFDEVLSLDLDGFSVGDFAAPGQAAGNPAAWTWTPGTPPGDPGNVFADLVMQFSAELAALP